MSPLISHRRSRRRSSSRRVVIVVCVLVVAALLIGGVARVAVRSDSYKASLNLSFAAQGAIVAADSNTTASSLRRLLAHMEDLGRPTLQADLDSLTEQARQQAVAAGGLPAPGSGEVQARFSSAFSERAAAVSQVRLAIDGLLGMHPLSSTGGPKASGVDVATPRLLSSTEAADRIAAAGSLLTRSDRNYASARRSLSGLGGHGRLPTSKWVTTRHQWQIGVVSARVNSVASSSSLAATHQLVLSAVRLSPPALPPPSGVGTPTISILSPTHRVMLTVVVSNLGSVDAPHASVQFTLVPLPEEGVAAGTTTTPTTATTTTTTTATTTMTKHVGVASGESVSLSPAAFSVQPGHNYRLTVAILDLQAQTDLTATALTQELQIAPGT